MIREIVESINETYGSGSVRAEIKKVDAGEFQIDLPAGEPGVYMMQALRERVSVTDQLILRSSRTSTSVRVFDETLIEQPNHL